MAALLILPPCAWQLVGCLRKGEPSGRFPLCMRLGGVSPLLATQKGALLKAFHAARRRVVPYLDTSLEPPLSERDQVSRPGHFMGVSPDTRWTLAGDDFQLGLEVLRRGSGECPARLRRCQRAVGDAAALITEKREEPNADR